MINKVENYTTNVKGFDYVSFYNIENFKSKLNSIGLNEDFISTRDIVYLFLINYLGVMTKEQLCYFTNLLESDIRTAINRLNATTSGKSDFVIDIEKDDKDKEAVYYFPKKAYEKLKNYTYEENIRTVKITSNKKHLSRLNDFYLSLFKNSDCERLTIDYNDQNFAKFLKKDIEDIEGNLKEPSKISPDGLLKACFNGNDYNIYIEQDNNTEKIPTLANKIRNYFNVCIHREYSTNKIEYFVFRLDMYLFKNQVWECNRKALKTEEYHFYKSELVRIEELRKKAKGCKDFSELLDFIKNNSIDTTNFEFSSNSFESNLNRFIFFLSSLKSKYRLSIDSLKRSKKIEYVCNLLQDRVDNIKKRMFFPIIVDPFDFDSKGSIYEDITGATRFSAEFESIESLSLLLRSNFLCGDVRIEKWFNKLIFNKKDMLIEFANELRGYDKFDVSKERVQKYIKLGEETLCFSNLIDDSEYGVPYANYVLLMPSVSVSDYARIEYICKSNGGGIEESLEGNYLLIYVVVDNERDMRFYNKMVSEYKSENGHISFLVRKVDL